MFCMRCGREIAEDQVFCRECLELMARNPVEPGTPVQLPVRSAQSASRRSSRKKELSPQVLLKRQRRLILWLCGALLASWVGLGVTVAMLLQEPPQEELSPPAARSSTRITETD